MSDTDELIALTASEAVRLLQRGELAPRDLVDAAETRIEAVDGVINAMPIRCFDRARDGVAALSARKEEPRRPEGWLAGLPIAVKDLSHVAGVPTTMGGSPVFEDFVPEISSFEVRNLEANGAVPVGKSASPEFGFNATTYSQLFGFTRNPWNTALSTAGSSGGAAAALASGEVWLATGSDLGASIRTPASFCGVVGLRPSPGLVPRGPAPHSFNALPVNGPMARNVRDTALMLDAMVGHQPGDPLSFEPPAGSYRAAAEAPRLPRRVAVSVDLGITHCDPEIAEMTRAAARCLEALGCRVEEVHPDFSGAIETFHAIRGTGHIVGMGPLLEKYPELMTEEIRWSVETARRHSADDIADAERARAALQARMAAFFEEYDLLLCPANVVPPFPVDWTSVAEHDGHVFASYIDWIAITFSITLTACPVLSVPCGFLGTGMPLGLQLVGAPRGEHGLFAHGRAFEEAMGLGQITPLAPRVADV